MQDRLSTLNQAYFAEFVKASIATFVHMSGCLVRTPSGTLNGHVLGADGGPGGGTTPLAGALVTIRQILAAPTPPPPTAAATIRAPSPPGYTA